MDDCGNRALSANDDTSEMIWGSDIKRAQSRVQQREGFKERRKGGRGIAPWGIVRIEGGKEREKRKRCFCANGRRRRKGKKGRERATC